MTRSKLIVSMHRNFCINTIIELLLQIAKAEALFSCGFYNSDRFYDNVEFLLDAALVNVLELALSVNEQLGWEAEKFNKLILLYLGYSATLPRLDYKNVRDLDYYTSSLVEAGYDPAVINMESAIKAYILFKHEGQDA